MFCVGDQCERNIDGKWYLAEITHLYDSYISVRYFDDGNIENDIFIDEENIRKPYTVVTPLGVLEDISLDDPVQRLDYYSNYLDDVEAPVVDTPPMTPSYSENDNDISAYTSDAYVTHWNNASERMVFSTMDDISYSLLKYQGVVDSEYLQTKKNTSQMGSELLRMLYLESCGALHSTMSVNKYFQMEFYWEKNMGKVSESDRFPVFDLKPLADLCANCESFTIFGCAKCDVFYCNKKCQRANWQHHKLYCENSATPRGSRHSRYNEYLKQQGYIARQRRQGKGNEKTSKPLQVTHNKDLLKLYPELGPFSANANVNTNPRNSAMVHPITTYDDYDDSDDNIGGATRKVYDIRRGFMPKRTSTSSSSQTYNATVLNPIHNHINGNVNKVSQSTNPWGVDIDDDVYAYGQQQEDDDELDKKRHGGPGSSVDKPIKGKLAEQWAWGQQTSDRSDYDSTNHSTHLYPIVPADIVLPSMRRENSNNSLYVSGMSPRDSPLETTETGNDYIVYDQHGNPVSTGSGGGYVELPSKSSMISHHQHGVDGTTTPPASHGYNNTRSSASGGDTLLNIVNSRHTTLNPLNLASEKDGSSSHYSYGGRNDVNDCRSPHTLGSGYGNNGNGHWNNGYVSDNENVPDLLPMNGIHAQATSSLVDNSSNSSNSSRVSVVDSQIEEMVVNLRDGMGFPEQMVRDALRIYPTDMEMAVNYIINQQFSDDDLNMYM